MPHGDHPWYYNNYYVMNTWNYQNLWTWDIGGEQYKSPMAEIHFPPTLEKPPMINPIIEIREDGEVIYSGAFTAERAYELAKRSCKVCNGTGVLHMDNNGGRETDVTCQCVLKHRVLESS